MRHRVTSLLVITAAAITLGGCLPDQTQQVTACQAEADRFFLSHRAANTDDPRSQFIIACMASKGYEFTIEADECSSQKPLPTQAACYTTTNWLLWIVEQITRPLKITKQS